MLASLVAASLAAALPSSPATAQDYTLGIDASHHQGDINWQRVADSGHVFVWHKATEGATFVDDRYAGNRAEAGDAGIPFGAYHFARPNGDNIAAAEADAAAEAQHFLDTADPAPGDMLPVLDMEATGGLNSARLIAWTQSWLDEVEQGLDVKALIYASPSFWETNLANTTTFAEQGFPLWIAHYTSARSPRTPASNWNGEGWSFWQWTNCARVPGISGCVDENRFSGSDLGRYTIPGAPEPEPSTDPATPPSNESPPQITGEAEVGQKLSASTGTWNGSTPLSYGYAWHRCDENGSGCTAILNGTRPGYRVAPADFGHRLRVTVTATNSAGSASQDSDTTDVVTDTTAPVAPRIVKPRRAQTLKNLLNVEWARAEEDARYDVRYRRSTRKGGFAEPRELVTATRDRSARLPADKGFTYCFSARATDVAGNTSGWSEERCTVVPLDDRDLAAGPGWASRRVGAAYLGTLRVSGTRRAALTATGVSVREIFIVAETCPDCARVAVLLNGKRVGAVDLTAPERRMRDILRVVRFTSRRRGDVSIVVISRRRPAFIDGLVLAVR